MPALPRTAIAAPAIAQSIADAEMAIDGELAEIARYVVWHLRTVRQICSEATDGKFQIQSFAAGEIVPGLQVLDAVQNGTVEMGHSAHYYYIGKDPTWALFCATPFGLNARQQNAWFYDGDGQKLIDDFGAKFNTKCLSDGQHRRSDGRLVQQGDQGRAATSTASRCGSAAGPARRSPSSASLRSRSPVATFIRRWRRAPSTPTEWVGPYDDEKLGFYKVAKFYYYPGWWEGGTANHLLINLAKWNELPKGYQAILEAAAAGFANIRSSRPITTRAIRRPSSAWLPTASNCDRSRGRHGGLSEGVEEVNAETSAANPTTKRSGIRSSRSAATNISGGRSPNIATTPS